MRGQCCIKNNMSLEQQDSKIKPGASPEFAKSNHHLPGSSNSLIKNSLHEMVPFHVTQLCSYIKKYGFDQKNVLQDLESDFLVTDLKNGLNISDGTSFVTDCDVSSATELLKLFLERLPEPLIPASICNIFCCNMKSCNQKSSEHVKLLKELVDQLPIFSFSVLKYLSHFFHQMAKSGEKNGLSYEKLGIIFGPIIFRLTEVDPHIDITKKATQFFASDYHTIFEHGNVDGKDQSHVALPVPSTVMPVVLMEPLSVVIPFAEETAENDDQRTNSMGKQITEHDEINHNLPEDPVIRNGIAGSIWSTRKLKESAFTNDELHDRYNPESFPNQHFENVLLETKLSNVGRTKSEEFKRTLIDNFGKELKSLAPLKHVETTEGMSSPCTNYAGNSNSSSPHPQGSKHHETPSTDFNRYYENQILVTEQEDISPGWCFIHWDSQTNNQKSLSSNSCQGLNIHAQVNDGESNLDSDSVSSWDLLFDAEEPVRSESRLISPLPDGMQDELLSPSIHSLRKSNSYEAPLSPSAYKQYLSHRSSHVDPSVPPSPPIDQEHFDRGPVKEVTVSVKQMTKKIHVIKKKLKNFDAQYEKQYGYQPSHAEKMNFSESKKLLCQLHKARKRLKILREESQLNSVFENWQPSRDAHILEDTTNCLKEGYRMPLKSSKPSIHSLWGETLKGLNHERKLANRPEDLEDMTKSQAEDEKLAIQTALLGFERIHGKPLKSEDRNTIRPLYERYRNVKRLLAKTVTFPISSSKALNSPSLQPIIEHEAMDFSALLVEKPDCEEIYFDAVSAVIDDADFFDVPENIEKYDNSNLHELPLSEMIIQQQEARVEKRRLRRTLKEFETDFLRLHGRVVQKEDKASVDFLYSEYKIVKARVRLLEALISKHNEHNF